jgi:hypothetical protein
MSATAGGQPFAGSPLTWNLFFARQPEPDLEFTEEELEQTANIRSSTPMNSPKKSGGRPLLWILLLILIGSGGVYVAMEPEMVMDLIGPLLGETPAPTPQPPVAMKPAPPPPESVPSPPPAQQAPAETAPAPSLQTPQAAGPGPAPVNPPAAAMPPTVETAAPLFGEGQRVTLLPNPGAPQEKVSLRQDAAGAKPGPAVPPGTAFTILDGDLQDRGWVYYVRSDYGTTGWLEEKQLQAKR